MLARKLRGLKARTSYVIDRLRPKTPPVGDYQYGDLCEVVFRKTVGYDWRNTPAGAEVTIAGVATAASRVGRSVRVLDHGGACGFHYQVASRAIPHLSLRWAVVETPAMAERARELETERLRFFSDKNEAVDWLGGVDLLHSSGAVQCFPLPFMEIHALLALEPDTVLWARMDLSSGPINHYTRRSRISGHGPGGGLPDGMTDAVVEVEMVSIPESDFIGAHVGHRLAWKFAGAMPAFLFMRE